MHLYKSNFVTDLCLAVGVNCACSLLNSLLTLFWAEFEETSLEEDVCFVQQNIAALRPFLRVSPPKLAAAVPIFVCVSVYLCFREDTPVIWQVASSFALHHHRNSKRSALTFQPPSLSPFSLP
jgi:hypothetical protein